MIVSETVKSWTPIRDQSLIRESEIQGFSKFLWVGVGVVFKNWFPNPFYVNEKY